MKYKLFKDVHFNPTADLAAAESSGQQLDPRHIETVAPNACDKRAVAC